MLGRAIRAERKRGGWSRAELVAQMPSGIGDRTLLTYEQGSRQITAVRLMEICGILGVDVSALLHDVAIAIGEIHTIPLRVDLHALAIATHSNFDVIHVWARNKMENAPSHRTAILNPVVVSTLATAAGCPHKKLATYLLKFLPEGAFLADEDDEPLRDET